MTNWPGWLDGLLDAMDDGTGVVVPMHKNQSGELSFSGCQLRGNSQGDHIHLTDRPEGIRVIPSYCSAIMLIDLDKVGDIRMGSWYEKFFFDIAHGLEVWEAGFKAVVTPEVLVTHLGGATADRKTALVNGAWNRDRQTFALQWMQSGRLEKLETGIWQGHDFIQKLLFPARTIKRVFSKLQHSPGATISQILLSLVISYQADTEYLPLIYDEIGKAASLLKSSGDDKRAQQYLSVAHFVSTQPEKIEKQNPAQVENCKQQISSFLTGTDTKKEI